MAAPVGSSHGAGDGVPATPAVGKSDGTRTVAPSLKRPRPSTSSSSSSDIDDDLVLDEAEASLMEQGSGKHEGNSNGVDNMLWPVGEPPVEPARFRHMKRAMIFYGTSSTLSSLSLAFVSARVVSLPLAAIPLVAYFATVLSLGSGVAFAAWRRWRIEGLADGWRESWRAAAGVGAAGVLALWCRAEAMGRLGLGVPMAFDVFAAPALLLLLPLLGLGSAWPSAGPWTASCLVPPAVTLALLAQSAPLAGIVLSFLSAAFSAIHLALLKRWFASRSGSALSIILRSSAFGLCFSVAPIIFAGRPPSVESGGRSIFEGHSVVSGQIGAMAIVIFGLLRLIDSFGEALAVEALYGPVGMTLLSPLRNLVGVAAAPVLGVYLGVAYTLQLALVYVLCTFGIVASDTRTFETFSPSATPLIGATITADDKPGHHRTASWTRTSAEPPIPSSWRRLLYLCTFAPLAFWGLINVNSIPKDMTAPLFWGSRRGTLDVVFSYYDEPLPGFTHAVGKIRSVPEIASRSLRIIIYVKHPDVDMTKLLLETDADEVYRLPNEGREGATYLHHILRHYNYSRPDVDFLTSGGKRPPWIQSATDWSVGTRFAVDGIVHEQERGLADHTLFMQPHVGWEWIADRRWSMFDSERTGFLSLGPYLTSDCGVDGLMTGTYERMKDIYVLFRETFCPPTKQLSAYAAQFFVSRKRILHNPYRKYETMLDLLTASPDHWLHREGHWFKWKGNADQEAKTPDDPVNPFLGHSLERSWPVIFGCEDPGIAARCGDEETDARACQCYDRAVLYIEDPEEDD